MVIGRMDTNFNKFKIFSMVYNYLKLYTSHSFLVINSSREAVT